ncbi:ABC transporter ATP-binding protein [Pseudoxanthomonas helianthi]|uniref:ABC transporter ATP-binding protein n=2 Tax=Pseudoxanthomonas helianthi TaxID=1453541 RepID=A0A941ARS6_9GAMM|nr:ABC transporter ATP-binding protein [Pseudoxanthomonas helianthi]
MFPIYDKPHHRLLELFDPRQGLHWRREFHALRGIDLEIGRGQCVGIVGRNGSGKSTLLQIICGTLAPSSGAVQVNGRIAALLELGAGFNPEFTGRENVYLNASILGLGRDEIDVRLGDILAFADIGEFIDQPVKSYSSGMYVRLAFAVAINVTPEILVVDEALSVGDEAFQRKCFSRIEQIRESGATVLFVSHSAGTVVDLCDEAILIDHGEVLFRGAPRRVVAQYQKMIYAPPGRQPAIREAIRNDREGDVDVNQMRSVIQEHAKPQQDAQLAWFDPEMRPVSTVSYADRGAKIDDPRLLDVSGQRVNVLVHGEEYIYTYRVMVGRSLARVRCGMMIRTITGVEIGGHATDRDDQHMSLVPAGATIEVSFRFRCLLNPGMYFLNAGCLASDGDMEDYIDRHIDVAMFRVQPTGVLRSTALVDLVVEDSAEWRS